MMNKQDAGAILSINVGAIVSNWKELSSYVPDGVDVSAVVKSNAYGLGAVKIAPSLQRAGCKTFFVAYLEEGIEIRRAVGAEPHIFVLHGPAKGTEGEFISYNLTPILNTFEQIDNWIAYSVSAEHKFPCGIHFDTGMSRLGIPTKEAEELFGTYSDKLKSLNISLVMSHLASPDDKESPQSAKQLFHFTKIKSALTDILDYSPLYSLSATAGIFLGKDYAFDIVRPGAGIYGIHDTDELKLKSVVALDAKILQIQSADVGQSVGYGATYTFKKDGKIATAGIGYGDGFSRQLSNKGFGYIGDFKVPIIGRVSMDLTTFDVSEVPEDVLANAQSIEIIGSHRTIFDIARETGSISYEILDSLKNRYYRQYVGEVLQMPLGAGSGEV